MLKFIYEGCYTTNTGSNSSCPHQCRIGTFNSNVGQTSDLVACVPCQSGYYTDHKGATRCEGCYVGGSYYYTSSGATSVRFDSNIYHWQTQGGQKPCSCASNYVGTNCEYTACPQTLPKLSLGAVLFMADSQLRTYSGTFYNPTNLPTVTTYFKSLVQIQLDADSNGIISRTEMLTFLQSRSVAFAPQDEPQYIWLSSYDSSNVYVNEVDTQTLISDALRNLQMSAKHTFDGSGQAGISSISSIYPDESWTSDQCTSNDHYAHQSPQPSTPIHWTFATGASNINVCLYSNGQSLGANSQSTGIKNGAVLSYDYLRTDYIGKLVVCIQLNPPNFDCTVAVIYVSQIYHDIYIL